MDEMNPRIDIDADILECLANGHARTFSNVHSWICTRKTLSDTKVYRDIRRLAARNKVTISVNQFGFLMCELTK